MVGLHQILEAVNTGIIAAVGQIGEQKDGFTQTFSPITAELEAAAHDKMVADIIQIVLGAILVATFAFGTFGFTQYDEWYE